MSTKTTQQVKKIKPLLNFSKLTDTDLLKRLDAIHDGMSGNTTAFPTPPVDMVTFKAGIDSYNTLTTDALDGGKKAVTAKKKQREVVIKMATQLGHYVWAQSNNDLATISTSGFEVAQNVKLPLAPLPKAGI
jgi:Ca2+-binding RTX toxin-like protein